MRILLLCLIVCLWVSPVGAATWCDSSVACYTFEENTGTSTSDLSPNTNTGNFRGAGEPAWSATVPDSGDGFNGTSSYSVDYDGSNDYIDCGNNASINVTGNITMVSWINVDAFPLANNSSGYIIGHGYNGTNEGYSLAVIKGATGIIRLQASSYSLSGGAFLSSWNITGWNTGEWHHVVGQYDGTNWSVWFDGTSMASTAQASGALTSTSKLSLGSFNNGGLGQRVTNSKLDEQAIFDIVLDNTDIGQVMSIGVNGTIPSTPSGCQGTCLHNAIIHSGTFH